MLSTLTDWVKGAFLGSNRRQRRQRFAARIEALEPRQLLTVTLSPIPVNDLPDGKVEYVPLTAADSSQAPVSFTAVSDNASVTAQVVAGGRSIVMTVSGTDSSNQAFTGDLTFRLFEDLAPTTTDRIINLVNSGFYNGLIFHRVISGFVAQGGDPTGTGTGGSGVLLDDEFNAGLTFSGTGLLAMANAGDDTGDSQFFITDTDLALAALPQHLNFQHTIFGVLTSGFDTFKKLITVPTDSSNRPTNPVTITTAQVLTDTQNGVLRLSSTAGFTGTANITVTASNAAAESAQQSFSVNVVADTVNDRAFLGPVSNQVTTTGVPVTFNVLGTDLENDSLTFVIKDPATFSDTVTDAPPANVTTSIVVTPASGSTPASAAITLTPAAGFTGTISLLAGVRDQVNRTSGGSLDARSNFDTQRFNLTVNDPGPIPDAPAQPVLNPASDDGLFSNDGVTSVSTPVFTVTAVPGATVQFLVNGTTTIAASETSSGQYTATLTRQSLQLGANTVTATATTSGTPSTPSAPLSFTYVPSFANVYTVPGLSGTAQQVKFDWISRQAKQDNEIGVYVVDDLQGRVGGLLPGDPGYAAAALGSATRQVIFASGSNAGATNTISATGGQLLAYYLIANGTTARFLSTNPTNGTGGLRAFFSFQAANPDNLVHMGAVADGRNGQVQLNWEDLLNGGDRDFNDAIINVSPAGLATSVAVDVLRVPGSSANTVQAAFSLEQARRALTSTSGAPSSTLLGEFGFFVVDDNSGRIGTVSPGDAGYLSAALGSATRQTVFSSGATINALQSNAIPGGSLIAFYYIPGGTAAGVLASNPSNSSSGSPVALFSADAASPDGRDHFRWFGPEQRASDSPTGDSSSPLHLHIADKLGGNDSDFDAYKIGISFSR